MTSDTEYQKDPVKPTILSTNETNKLLQNSSFMKNSVPRRTLQTQNYIHNIASQLQNVRRSKESASDSSSDSLSIAQARSKSKNKGNLNSLYFFEMLTLNFFNIYFFRGRGHLKNKKRKISK